MLRFFRHPLPMLLGLIAILSTGCIGAPLPPTLPPASTTPGPAATPVSAPTDARGVAAALQQAGLVVAPAGPIQQPFFTSPGVAYNVNKDLVQIFTYPDAGAAERDAAKIAADGNVPGYSVHWVDQPHFYRQGVLLVIYVGSDAAVRAALDAILGPPFVVGAKPTGPPMSTAVP